MFIPPTPHFLPPPPQLPQPPPPLPHYLVTPTPVNPFQLPTPLCYPSFPPLYLNYTHPRVTNPCHLHPFPVTTPPPPPKKNSNQGKCGIWIQMLKHASFWIPQTYAVLYLGSIEAKTHWIPLFLGGFATMLPFFVTRFNYFICQWISQSISFFFTGFHKQIFNCFKMYPRRPISKRDTHKLLNFSLSPLFHFNFLFFFNSKKIEDSPFIHFDAFLDALSYIYTL